MTMGLNTDRLMDIDHVSLLLPSPTFLLSSTSETKDSQTQVEDRGKDEAEYCCIGSK